MHDVSRGCMTTTRSAAVSSSMMLTIVAVKVRMACQAAHRIHPGLDHKEAYFNPVVAYDVQRSTWEQLRLVRAYELLRLH